MAGQPTEVVTEIAGATKIPVRIDAFLRNVIRRESLYFAAVELPFAAGGGYKVIEVALNLVRDEHGNRITAD
jgi:hypothetical protein